MPTPALKSLVEKSDKTLEDAERYWESAKKEARKRGIYKKDGEDRYYAYVMGIVKQRLGLAS